VLDICALNRMQLSSPSENLFVNYVHLIFLSLVFFPLKINHIFSSLYTPSLFAKEKHICFSLVFLLDSFTKMKKFISRCNRVIKPSCMRVFFIRWFGIFLFGRSVFISLGFRLNICIISDGRFVRFYSENKTLKKIEFGFIYIFAEHHTPWGCNWKISFLMHIDTL
jgi:hypothetical protein